jgi:hypothetical protein
MEMVSPFAVDNASDPRQPEVYGEIQDESKRDNVKAAKSDSRGTNTIWNYDSFQKVFLGFHRKCLANH